MDINHTVYYISDTGINLLNVSTATTTTTLMGSIRNYSDVQHFHRLGLPKISNVEESCNLKLVVINSKDINY